MAFKKATKQQSKLRFAIHGPSGSGKTRSALEIGRHLGSNIALIDTERGSASKYANVCPFDVSEVFDDYHPDRLFAALDEAAKGGYDVIIIDSMTHFWNGPGGLLELVDEEVKKQKARGHKADTFAAWKPVDAVYRRVIQAILASPAHVIVTMRAKTEYEKVAGANGKTTVTKVGMAPEMRNQFEYEFDVEGMLSMDHDLLIGKTRCDALDEKVFRKPGKQVADILLAWLNDGAPAVAREATPARVAPPTVDDPQGADDDARAAPSPNPANDAAVSLADSLIALVRSSTTEPIAAAVVARAKAELDSAPDQLARFKKAYVTQVKTLRASNGAAA